jgi:cytochrome c55X
MKSPFVLALALATQMAVAEPAKPLTRLVRQDCGSCHGMRLTGGLGSPLTPEALRDKPDDGLVATILQGRPGTAMPAWASLIREADAAWIVGALKNGFPEEGQ